MKRRIIAMLLATLMLIAISATAYAANNAKQTADALHSLGLFLGVGDNADGTPNYDLDGNLTRAHAVILLVRMLGKEGEATKGTFSHPFKDTLEWYDKYVGYAYENKLTNGTSATTYSGSLETTAQMFVTFCLRSLGYDDMGENPDFSWDKASEKAKELGIDVDLNGTYTRGDAVETFWDTLNTKMKGSNKTLAEKLEADGVFSKSDFDNAIKIAKGSEPAIIIIDSGSTNNEQNTNQENNQPGETDTTITDSDNNDHSQEETQQQKDDSELPDDELN